MTDREALLRSIIENPADDTPRLIYADFIEEQGEADYAEFIHVGVELARHPGCEWQNQEWNNKKLDCKSWNERLTEGRIMTTCGKCRRENELRRRERELLKANREKWFSIPGLQPPWSNTRATCGDVVWQTGGGAGGDIYFGGTVSRGFISELTLSWQDWLSHEAKLYWTPGLTMPCRECCREPGGDLTDSQMALFSSMCEECGGSGRIPRPFPGATVQPITAVRLTTHPRWDANRSTEEYDAWLLGDEHRIQIRPTRRIRWNYSGGNAEHNAIRDLLAFEWPGIEFILPEAHRLATSLPNPIRWEEVVHNG